MRRVIANNSVILANADTVPNTGTPQYFTSGNPANNTPATVLPGWWANEIQDELQSFVEASGVADDGTHWSQVWGLLARSYTFSDTGTANAKVAGPSGMTWPFQAGWLGLGTFIRVKITTRNSGATTLAAFGTSALPVITRTGAALVGGELDAGSIHDFVHNGAGSWVVVSLQNWVPGRQAYTAATSTNFTVPAGVYNLRLRMWAAGGGGGGCTNAGGSAGAGGAGGEFAEGLIAVAPAQVIAVTIGTGGPGGVGSGANGTAGGNSSFGGLVTCNGGGFGQGSINNTVNGNVGAGGTGGGGTATVTRIAGELGGIAFFISGVGIIMGQGGTAWQGAWHQGLAQVGSQSNGGGGFRYGGGGGGAVCAGGTAANGGAGADGALFLEW